jgi:hypothetical protein
VEAAMSAGIRKRSREEIDRDARVRAALELLSAHRVALQRSVKSGSGLLSGFFVDIGGHRVSISTLRHMVRRGLVRRRVVRGQFIEWTRLLGGR